MILNQLWVRARDKLERIYDEPFELHITRDQVQELALDVLHRAPPHLVPRLAEVEQTILSGGMTICAIPVVVR